MILQEEFEKNGYTDILAGDVSFKYEIDLEDLFDSSKKPEELLNIYISEQKDDMFFVLNGNLMEIDSLCDQWDDRIRVFTISNGQSKGIHKLMYNIVQLIVYSGNTPDKSKESNLLISRKIIIKGNLTNKGKIEIDDCEAIELPFHMIPASVFSPDEEQIKQLQMLLPESDDLLSLLKKSLIKAKKKENAGVLDKSFEPQKYIRIKEWLER